MLQPSLRQGKLPTEDVLFWAQPNSRLEQAVEMKLRHVDMLGQIRYSDRRAQVILNIVQCFVDYLNVWNQGCFLVLAVFRFEPMTV